MFLTFIQNYPFFLSFIIGLVPALVWLWFWLKEDSHPEPAKMVTLSFLGGMVAVLIVLPLQKLVYEIINDQNTLSFILWATIEELCKFIIVYFIALKNKITDEPIDDIIYLIVSALGFVALENTFFLTDLVHNADLSGIIMTTNLRFIGAGLLHVISSATIGVCMALSFYKNQLQKSFHLFTGLILAIVLHTSFNLFIIRQTEGNVFVVFGAVWVGILVLLVLIEKIKHIHNSI
jgi:RsiW-degrading membrane proteinase PrsW (M82 family)